MMDGKYTPAGRIEVRSLSATFSVAANGATCIFLDGVIVDGKSLLGIREVWLGDSRLAMGCHAIDGTRYYIYVVNPTSTAVNNVTATAIFSYLC